MILPSLQYEQDLWSQGFVAVAGVDEVGRGAWAGPVVAGAVILSPALPDTLPLIRDSKTMSPLQRQKSAAILNDCGWCRPAVGLATVDEINLLGIAAATFLAMQRAIEQLSADHVLIDAFIHPTITLPQKPIVKGDSLCLSIAAASIVAKVFRDDLMDELSQKFPNYGLADHKGYGTKQHQQAIQSFGLTEIHRTGYQLKFLQ